MGRTDSSPNWRVASSKSCVGPGKSSELSSWRSSAGDAAGLYLQGHDPRDPLVSPLFADAAGWPPAQVFAGGEEVLLDDALGLTAALARAGVSVETHVVAGMQHVWPTLFADLAESAVALDQMGRFVARCVAGPG